jgi:hypothetical protein
MFYLVCRLTSTIYLFHFSSQKKNFNQRPQNICSSCLSLMHKLHNPEINKKKCFFSGPYLSGSYFFIF